MIRAGAGLVLLIAGISAGTPSSAQAVGVGGRAPEINLPDLEGRTLRVSRYRGKVVIVDIWASWCEPCRDELPALQRLYARHFRAGLRVVGINVDRDVEDAQRFARRHGILFRNAHDPQRIIARRYGLSTMPTAYIIDHRGIVRHVNAGYRAGDARRMERVVEELLAAMEEDEGAQPDDGDADPDEDPEDQEELDADPHDRAPPDDPPGEVEPSTSGRSGGLCSAHGSPQGAWPLMVMLTVMSFLRRGGPRLRRVRRGR